MRTVSLITVGTLIAVGAVFAPSLNFVPSYATVDVAANTVEATETFDGVLLSWKLADPEASIQILNNGDIVAEADSSGSALDPGALEGVTEYQVVVEEPAEIGDFDSEAPSDIENYSHVVTVPLKIGDEESITANASGNTPVTTFRYQTFIAAAFVDAPPVVCGMATDAQFKGDSRGWNVSSPNFRTRYDVQIDWRENGMVKATPSVGETQFWGTVDGRFQLIRSKTQYPEYFQTDVSYRSSSAVSFHVYHNVKNPLCDSRVTNGIYYEVDVRVWRGSGYSASGVMRKAPSHEFYVKDSDESSWTTVWRRGYEGFNCFALFEALDENCYSQSMNSGVRW